MLPAHTSKQMQWNTCATWCMRCCVCKQKLQNKNWCMMVWLTIESDLPLSLFFAKSAWKSSAMLSLTVPKHKLLHQLWVRQTLRQLFWGSQELLHHQKSHMSLDFMLPLSPFQWQVAIKQPLLFEVVMHLSTVDMDVIEQWNVCNHCKTHSHFTVAKIVAIDHKPTTQWEKWWTGALAGQAIGNLRLSTNTLMMKRSKF